MFTLYARETHSVMGPIILPAVSASQWIAGLSGIAIIAGFLVGFIYLVFGLVRLGISFKKKKLRPLAKKNIFLASIVLVIVIAGWGIFQVIQQTPDHPHYSEEELKEIFTTLFPTQPPISRIVTSD